MCDDDSFNVATVPRHAVFGTQAGKDDDDGDDESTLGDRFFDLLPLQTKSAAKTDLSHRMSLRDRSKLVPPNTQQHFEQRPTVAVMATAITTITDTAKVTAAGANDASEENINDDVPFELNRLAMFRPPSRVRLSGCRSNTVLREENRVHLSACAVELSNHENLDTNTYVEKETANHTSKIPPSDSHQSAKTLRCSVSRSSFPTQVNPVQSVQMKQRKGSVMCRPTNKLRAVSAEPRSRRLALGLTHTNGPAIRKSRETGVRIQPHGPLRVRSASTGGTANRNIGAKAENAVKTNEITMAQRQNRTNLITKLVVREKMVSKPEATRKSLYGGPETRARARMKQSNENSGVVKINSAASTPKRSLLTKSVHSRPLSQMNPNIPKNAVKNGIGPTCNTKNAGNGHVPRSRTRVAHGPVRVQGTQGKVKEGDGLPPVESESRFRQSLTRRPKGGDSLDRDVTNAEGEENGDEIWTVVAKKPEPVLEFAPCLRSRVIAKKMQSTSTTSTTNVTKPPKTGQSRYSGSDAPVAARRRTEAEREAFFRRLSTPKTLATIKKCPK